MAGPIKNKKTLREVRCFSSGWGKAPGYFGEEIEFWIS